MNLLRWNRKSNKKIRPKTLLLFIFSLIMTTFAWFAYSKVLEPALNIHMASWDIEYYIGEEKKTNPIEIEIPILYPTMEEQAVVVDIVNNGETKVDIDYQVKSLTIAGTTYETVYEGFTPTTDNYITIAPSLLETVETVNEETGEVTDVKEIYKSAITNDITRFPFTIEIEYSAQVDAVSENEYDVKVSGKGYLKATVNWVGDNDRLDSEWGYIVGEFLKDNPTETVMSIVLSIDSYQVDPDGTTLEVTMPRTDTTRPYLPEGFKRVVGTSLTTGLVVEDASGNQYVWIEVPKSKSVYSTSGIEITEFTEEEISQIETDLRNYVAGYSSRVDQHLSYDAIGVSASNYTTLKQNMLKSIYTYGGFYIGRYETGVEDAPRTKATSSTPSTVPVIKANVYPYNFVTCAQANTIAGRLAQDNYQTSLLFGIQWDLVLKYLETQGTPQEWLKTDSTLFGNYVNNAYSLTNVNIKYNLTISGWHAGLEVIPYEKNEDEEVLLGSGANSGFCSQNIYDLAGNLAEWTYNVALIDGIYVGGNGGDYSSASNGTTSPANYCGTNNTLTGAKNIGFRVALFSNIIDDTVWGDDGI